MRREAERRRRIQQANIAPAGRMVDWQEKHQQKTGQAPRDYIAEEAERRKRAKR